MKTLRTCSKGHRYYKSSDCPVCPICEKERVTESSFLSELSAPARRALEAKGIKTIMQLSKYSEVEILSLHGVGSSTVPKLKIALQKNGLKFKE